jgi:predicted metal-binding protein
MDNDITGAVTIKDCARCGGNHTDLPVRKFKSAGVLEFTHWTTCPTNEEPILISYEKDTETPPAEPEPPATT